MSALILHGTARKIPLVLLLWLAWSISPAKGQGVQVVFANITSGSNACGPRINAPIYGIQGACASDELHGNSTNNGGSTVYIGPLLAGTSYTLALFAGQEGTSASGLQQVAQAPFRTGANAGYIVGRTVEVPWLTPAPGTRPVFQVRAWDNRGGTVTSWSHVMADPSLPSGKSELFSPQCPSPLPGQTHQIWLSGLTSFNLTLPAVGYYSVISYTTNVVTMPGENVTLAANIFPCQVRERAIAQQWWRAGMAIPGATNTTLVLSNVSYADAGKYGFAIETTSHEWPQAFTMRLFIPPRITGIQFSPPHTATLTYDTGPDLNISVQAATSLSNWVTLHTGPATGQFQDNNATNQTRRYRLRLEP